MYCVTDHLVLRTVDGAADLLIEELRAMSSIHSIRQTSASTVECTIDGPLDELFACPLYSTVAVRDVEKSLQFGVLSTLDPPADRDVNLTQSSAEFRPLSWTRRFGRLERLPWSTNLIVAEVLVRLAKIRPGHRVLDPFCGTGTILLAVRRRTPNTQVVGTDHDPHALEIADRTALPIVRAKAEALPLEAGSVDRVVTNLPFGKQVGSHELNRTLYPAALAEIDRVLTADGRAVLLTEDKRLLHKAIQRLPALKVVRERLLKYNGATPTAYVLTRLRPK